MFGIVPNYVYEGRRLATLEAVPTQSSGIDAYKKYIINTTKSSSN